MKIAIATPAPRASRVGNRVTAERWRSLLKQLDHDVSLIDVSLFDEKNCPDIDLLIALHARKCFPVVRQFKNRFDRRPIIVALAGTDLSEDLTSLGPRRDQALESLSLAQIIVGLHPLVRAELPTEFHDRVEIILQSARPLAHPPPKIRRFISLVVGGHLRPIKDPLLPARAGKTLPARSRIQIDHYGAAMNSEMLEAARCAMKSDRRYRWRGEKSRGAVRQAIARAHGLIHPSLAEGGANTVSESLVLGTPILASAIPGNSSLLGNDYPGLFTTGDPRSLSRLLQRFESDQSYRDELQERCAELSLRHQPKAERNRWRTVLKQLCG